MSQLVKSLATGSLGIVALGATVILLGGCLDDPPEGAERSARVEHDHALVVNYCAYSAPSSRQLEGCILNADPVEIERQQSNAARYASGDLVNCLPDAGRFCRQGRFVNEEYPPRWKRLLDGRHTRKGKPDPQCGYYYETLRASIDAETGYDRCKSEIELYCAYGAVSRAQLQGCEENVTWGQIKGLDTNATRYAESGGLEKCGADAGPFCRTLEPDYDQ
jgi:hypothetical protein